MIEINGRAVGAEQPVFLAAEIGINHNGDLDLACRMIDAAADAGADGVKFQNYRTEDFVADRESTYEYVRDGRRIVERQFDLFKRCELSRGGLRRLRDHAARRRLAFHSTPTSADGVAALVELGAPVLKNGSDFLTNLPLIEAFGRTGLPTVLSCGMATLAEIDDAVRTFRATGNDKVILLHCTSAYPTPPRDVNLRRIPALAAVFGCPVGFSDHTDGISAAVGAVALGACWIEKHFTLDKSLAGPDQRFSADPAEWSELVRAVRGVEEALGSPAIGPAPSEELGRREFRLSCVAAKPLGAGHRLSDADVEFRRPGAGVSPSQRGLLVGRTLRRAVQPGRVLQLTDVE